LEIRNCSKISPGVCVTGVAFLIKEFKAPKGYL